LHEVTLQLEADANAASSRHEALLDAAFERAHRLHECLLRDLCGAFFQRQALKVVATVLQLSPTSSSLGGDSVISSSSDAPIDEDSSTAAASNVSSPSSPLPPLSSNWQQAAATQVLVAAVLSAPGLAHLPNVVFAFQSLHISSDLAVAAETSSLSLRPLKSLLGASGLVAVRRALIGRATAIETWSQSQKCQLDDVSALTALAGGKIPLTATILPATRPATGALALTTSAHMHREEEEEEAEQLVNEEMVVALLSSASDDASNGQQLRLSPFRGPLARLIAAFLRVSSSHDTETNPIYSSSSSSTAPRLEAMVGSTSLRVASARYATQWAQHEAPYGTTKASQDSVDLAWNATLVSLIQAFSLPATGRRDYDKETSVEDSNTNSLDIDTALWVLNAALTQHLSAPSTGENTKGANSSKNSGSTRKDGSAFLKLLHWLRTSSAQSVLQTAAPTVVATLSDLCATEAAAQASVHRQRDLSPLWSVLWTDDVIQTQPEGTGVVLQLQQLSGCARQLLHVASLEVARSCRASTVAISEPTPTVLESKSDRLSVKNSGLSSLLSLIDGTNGLLWAKFVSWIATESAQATSEAENARVKPPLPSQ